MIIDTKDLEIAAVGISIAAGCQPCTKFHMNAASTAGASDAEIAAGMKAAITVSNAATFDLQRQFDSKFDAPDRQLISGENLNRQGLLAAIGASVARNSVAQLRITIGTARRRGMSDAEIMEIISLANRIKEKAASHLGPVVETLDADPGIAAAVASLCT